MFDDQCTQACRELQQVNPPLYCHLRSLRPNDPSDLLLSLFGSISTSKLLMLKMSSQVFRNVSRKSACP